MPDRYVIIQGSAFVVDKMPKPVYRSWEVGKCTDSNLESASVSVYPELRVPWPAVTVPTLTLLKDLSAVQEHHILKHEACKCIV